jgi:hypothetical protein
LSLVTTPGSSGDEPVVGFEFESRTAEEFAKGS